MPKFKPHNPGFPLYNKDHPLARGLVFGVIPGGMHRQDIVSGNHPSVVGTGSFNSRKSPIGSVWESTSTSNGGLNWPITNQIKTLADTNACTLFAWFEIDSFGSYSNLIGIPYRLTGSWFSPWFTICLNRDANNTTGSCNKGYSSSSRHVVNSSSGFYTNPAPMQMFTVTVNIDDVTFYKNGIFFSNHTFGGTQTFDFASAQEISVAHRSSNPTGEGVDGGVSAAYMWNRALSAKEISQLYGDPFVIIRPERKIYALGSVIGVGTDPLVDEQIMMM